MLLHNSATDIMTQTGVQLLYFMVMKQMLVVQIHVAYCFAEKQGYSKFGKYVGNGNAPMVFVYTGFKPAYYD